MKCPLRFAAVHVKEQCFIVDKLGADVKMVTVRFHIRKRGDLVDVHVAKV